MFNDTLQSKKIEKCEAQILAEDKIGFRLLRKFSSKAIFKKLNLSKKYGFSFIHVQIHFQHCGNVKYFEWIYKC